jgi:integrase
MSTGTGTIYRRIRIWWVQVSVAGRVVRRSSRSESYEVAKSLRNRLLGQGFRGELGGTNAKITLGALLDQFLDIVQYRARPKTREIQVFVANANLRPFFGNLRADKLTSERLHEYRKKRQSSGAAPSTVNRELSLLRSALRTAARATPPLIPISAIPQFTMVREDDRARQGFLTDVDFEGLLKELPSYLVPLTVVAHNTGIRLCELLTIRWDQIDFDAGFVRLKSGETKTGKPRTVPMIGGTRQALIQAKQERDEFWPDCIWVFQRLGTRII